MTEQFLLLGILAAFTWGLRHGVDWDHIAAITDITSTSESPRKGMILGSLYALGHSSVVAFLGLIAIMFGQRLPGWMDAAMGYFVGITLVLLGAYVIIAFLKFRGGVELKIKSRWWLLLNGTSHAYEYVRSFITRTPLRKPKKFLEDGYMPATAFGIGAIHGIGAETPTQMMLFIGAAGFSGSFDALMLLAAFITGMLITNTSMIIASSIGYVSMGRHRKLYTGAIIITGAYSLIVGMLFLFGAESSLPPFFAEP